MINKYTSIFSALGVFLIIALFIIVRNVGERQNSTSRASASSTISFTSDTTSPNVGDTVSVDVTINPGNNAVSLINLTVSYDSSKLNPLSNGFTPNTTAFPATLDGPTYNTCSGTQCTMYIALSIGSVPTNAITTTTRVATLNFQALSAGATQLSCTDGSTQVYSVSSQDQANENVLSSCTPVSITIGGSGTVTPIPTSATTNTPTPTVGAGTPTPTGTNPTATLVPGTTATPTPTPSTKINLNLGLTGVGIDGGNTHPLHPLREITFYLYNVDTNAITTVTNSVVFDGKYFVRPVIDLGQITNGNYQIFIHSPGYLTARLNQNSGTNTIAIKNGDSVQVTPNTLVVGDIAPLHDNTYGDNVLDILDYNSIISCYKIKASTSSCVNKIGADLDDNGVIDAVDYNLMLRSFLQTRQGDTIPGNPNL